MYNLTLIPAGAIDGSMGVGNLTYGLTTSRQSSLNYEIRRWLRRVMLGYAMMIIEKGGRFNERECKPV